MEHSCWLIYTESSGAGHEDGNGILNEVQRGLSESPFTMGESPFTMGESRMLSKALSFSLKETTQVLTVRNAMQFNFIRTKALG